MTGMSSYLLRHIQVFFYSLGQMALSPFATVMTTAVLGVALALPSGMFVLLSNLESVLSDWDGKAKITIYLKSGINEQQSRQLASTIRKRAEVLEVDYISADAALTEFRELSGFGQALDGLGQNPLPHTLLVRSTEQYSQPLQLKRLQMQFSEYVEVEHTRIDMDWIQRLHAISNLIRRGVILLSFLLVLAILLVISNTIRLAILNRRDEIDIINRIGGTDAFVRRPFLYSGFIQGTLGGTFGWILVEAALILLHGPIKELARLYDSSYKMSGMSPEAIVLLIAGSGCLGWLASHITVGRHLKQLQPE